ncbi:MAG: LON peptidase substrate-binding domain-containing protein [Bryobacterales bacterium]|nr:LON peptidase substrate-binding domain-containing protein [Bryobacterales bacterium]
MAHSEVLPLFPLPLVLFPRTPLPLHIFEERYKKMIGEAISFQSEFGVVLGKDKGIVSTGCSASVESVRKRYPDGRMDIQTWGRRRFEILELVEGEEYLRASVRYFDDASESYASAELIRQVAESFRKVCRDTNQSLDFDPDWNDAQLSFQLAQIVGDADFRQQLLTMRSEQERLERLVSYFPFHLQRFKHNEAIRERAPQNGHSKHLPVGE